VQFFANSQSNMSNKLSCHDLVVAVRKKPGFHASNPRSSPINIEPPMSDWPLIIWTMVNPNIHKQKKMATGRLYFGSQSKMPAASCSTPNNDQTIVGILASNEQGGSKNFKNLSRPTIKNMRLVTAVSILAIKFI